MTVQELYEHQVKALPAADRLRLATLILNEIPPQSLADFNTVWTDDDIADFTKQTWKRAEDGEDTGTSAR